MKRNFIIALVGLIILILQQTVIMNISLFGIKIDLLLIFIVSISMFIDKTDIIFTVLPIGIVKDAFFPYVFGLNTLILVLVSLIVCMIEKKIYKDTIIIPMIFTFFATLIKLAITLLFLLPTGILGTNYNYIGKTVLFETLFNSALAVIVYNYVKRMMNSETLKREWKF